MKRRLKPRTFYPGDTLRLFAPLPGLCPGWYRVVSVQTGLMELSIGDITIGTTSEFSRYFFKDRQAVVDWDSESLKFQEFYCKLLRDNGEPCPHCEEILENKRKQLLAASH